MTITDPNPNQTNVETTLSEKENGMTATINQDVNKRVNAIIAEMNDGIKERAEVIHGAWVGRIAQEHLLMLGPGGTGKSYFQRSMADHITGSKRFECAFDETTDPSQVFGPPDIKGMVEEGKTRRVIDNMLPEATDAFLDEFFNGNGPLLHSIMPLLNERVFHNNGMPMAVPLRQVIMGTNKLNADADQAALWDRVHLRYIVDYVKSRDNMVDMVSDAIARMSIIGRGVGTSISTSKTLVTIEELDEAHKEALGLDVPEAVIDLFFDIRDELRHGTAGIVISDRRVVEGMAAVLSNAWVRNHAEVRTGDLDILADMWWTVQDQRSAARGVILGATNPGEKAALDLLDELDKVREEIKQANDSGMDQARKTRVGVQAIATTDKLLREAKEHLVKAEASGASTTRIKETVAKAESFKIEVGKSVFNLDEQSMAAMTKANA